MKKSTNSNNIVKLVWVAGVQVRADQVEGRLKALAHGRKLKEQLHSDEAEEDKQLADQGYSPSEIACLRHANRVRTMENMCLGTSARVRRITFPN